MNGCALNNTFLSFADTCNLSQVVKQPTRICYKADGMKSETCIDYIFTNAVELCSKAISVPVGCSDHNLIPIGRKTKVPKSGPKILLKRRFKNFNDKDFCDEVRLV